MNVGLKNEVVFYGEKGYIVVDHYWKSRKFEVYLNDGTHTSYDYPTDNEFIYEVEHIHECINNKVLTSPIMTPNKTIETVGLVETLYKKWHLI